MLSIIPIYLLRIGLTVLFLLGWISSSLTDWSHVNSAPYLDHVIELVPNIFSDHNVFIFNGVEFFVPLFSYRELEKIFLMPLNCIFMVPIMTYYL